MSRIRLTLALAISVTLIGGALWFRFDSLNKGTTNIIAINEPNPLLSNEAVLEDFVLGDEVSLGTTTTPKPLTPVDVVSRGLFSDYISLKSQDGLTSTDITTIANKYAQNIIATEVPTHQVNINQIVTTPDSEISLTSYDKTIASIHNKYKNLTIVQYDKNKNQGLTNPDSLTLYAFMKAVGELYGKAAKELLSVKAPSSLAVNHLNLVNLYFANADLMRAVGNTPENPLATYTALNTFVQNGEKETVILSNIRRTLQANGIISTSNI